MTQTFSNNRRSTQSFLIALLAASACTSNIAATAAAELPADWQERTKFGVREYEAGNNHGSFDTFSKLMVEGSNKFGASDGRMARLYTNMGEVYDEEKQYAYAEQCLKKGLNIAQKGYGASSIHTVPALINLAQTYVHQGKDAQAQPLFKQALAIVDKPGDEKLLPFVVVVETDLGAMYFAQGNYAFGEPHLKRALQVATQSLGPTHKWTTTVAGMYASCLRAHGKSKEAKAVQQAAVAKANETQSPIGIWNKQIELADQAIADKRYSDAEAALKLAIQASQDLATEPMLQVVTLTRYGRLLVLQDMPVQAIEKWKAAQILADSILGLEDKAVLEHAKQLADLEKTQNQYRDAEPLYRRVMTNAEKRFGPDSAEYAMALTDLAGLYNSWAQYPKAVTYYSKLLVLEEKQFGTDSDKLIPTLVTLANAALNNTQRFSEVNSQSEVYLKRAEGIATKHFGKNSKELATILDALSHYYQKHLEWEKAAKTCTQVITADEKNFGPDSAETIKALEHYAVVLRAAGWRDKAEPIEARIAKIKGTKNPSDN